MTEIEWIVHICPGADWRAAVQVGSYQADSLAEAGFIHCSRPEQALGVANRFYQGVLGLVLLWIDPHLLTAQLRWEAADGEDYPHLYGLLNLDAVQGVVDFLPDEDGQFRNLPTIGA